MMTSNNPDSKAPKLLPCPFCGGEMLVVDNDEICCPVEYEASARCSECDAQGPGAYRYDTVDEAISGAISAWNSRPKSPQQAAKVLLEGGSYADFADAFAEMGRMIEEREDPEVAFFNVMKALAESKDD